MPQIHIPPHTAYAWVKRQMSSQGVSHSQNNLGICLAQVEYYLYILLIVLSSLYKTLLMLKLNLRQLPSSEGIFQMKSALHGNF